MISARTVENVFKSLYLLHETGLSMHSTAYSTSTAAIMNMNVQAILHKFMTLDQRPQNTTNLLTGGTEQGANAVMKSQGTKQAGTFQKRYLKTAT